MILIPKLVIDMMITTTYISIVVWDLIFQIRSERKIIIIHKSSTVAHRSNKFSR